MKILKVIYLIIVIFLPLIFFIFIQEESIDSEKIVSKVNTQLSYLSWVVTAITSILAFGVLYLTILFDKKIFKNVQSTKQFYRPYSWDKQEIKHYIYDVVTNKWKYSLEVFFLVFSITTLFINLFWVLSLSHYSNYKLWSFKEIFSFEWFVDINVMTDILSLFLPVMFWVITSGISIIIAYITESKGVSGKMILPESKQKIDVPFLHSQNADLSELFLKTGPILTLYTKYDDDKEMKDLYLEQEIPWKNYYAIYKFYNKGSLDYKLYFKCEHEIEDIQPQTSTVDIIGHSEFSSYLNSDCNMADVTFYTADKNVFAKFKLSIEIQNDLKSFMPFRKIIFDKEKPDIEMNRLEQMNEDFDLEKLNIK
ncbi:hypothetical protein ABE61_18750 [Lysinibacillus sphaericus]|uniref:hypothetical protein n=1 Tax=Lysinibacillus sphaericus TaxID=1421 RepID=UPI0018CF7B19|nr:hypothetical protein [Lysinibacillus sphaericus]MBG9456026.1 hypothetical protein [Lysinibacillus sphaericus]MBG9479313.1 hypothetical protein [Lysinibacillus sphaericus]MBG9593432.1 hypothetical protein [Lysinibacillus sphaericus]